MAQKCEECLREIEDGTAHIHMGHVFCEACYQRIGVQGAMPTSSAPATLVAPPIGAGDTRSASPRQAQGTRGGAMENGSSPRVQLGKTRFVLTPLLLGIVTLGIYNLVWLYKIHDELLNHTGDKSINPGKAIGFLFIPVFNFFWSIYLVFHVPGLIKNMEMDDGVPMSEQTNAGMIGVTGIIPVVNLMWSALVQRALNRHWRRLAPAEAP